MSNKLKTVYKYDNNYIYQGETFIQESPLEEGSYLTIPNTTEKKPIDFVDNKEFLKFYKDKNKWEKHILLDKNLSYYNKANGLLTDLSPYTSDVSNYTNIKPPYNNQEDKIYFNNDSKKWQFSSISSKTKEVLLQNAKDDKIEEIEEIYCKVQQVKIINGVTFYMPIRGELFNVTFPQMIAAGRNIEEGNSYVRIVDINKTIFTGKMPYDLLQEVYNICYEISITNNNDKHYFIDEINKTKTIEEVENYEFEYITDCEINLNIMIDDYIKESENKKGVEYLKNRKKQDSNDYTIFKKIEKINI